MSTSWPKRISFLRSDTSITAQRPGSTRHGSRSCASASMNGAAARQHWANSGRSPSSQAPRGL
eukprot:scaffold1060_cov246-Pinguiococcus_pyrenoidosus.AAC.16